MEEIQKDILDIQEKIANINEYVNLALKRENINEDLNKLFIGSEKVSEILSQTHNCMQNSMEDLLQRHKHTMMRMRKLQALSLDYVQQKLEEKADKEKNIENQIPHMVVTPASIMKTKANRPGFVRGEVLTPLAKAHLKYTPSRSANKPPLSLSFDFDFQVCSETFETIPKYMRGRETRDDLQNCIDSLIIPCFKEKYQLLNKKRSQIPNLQELEIWRLYNEQSSYIVGRTFITAGDISRKLGKMIDRKLQNRLVMLRHIGVLQEQRVSQTVCYIWNIN